MRFGTDERVRLAALDTLRAAVCLLVLFVGTGVGQECYAALDSDFKTDHRVTALFGTAMLGAFLATMILTVRRTQPGD